MTYYESAKAITITQERALVELKKHGITGDAVEEFYRDLGRKAHYSAQAVLQWLGY